MSTFVLMFSRHALDRAVERVWPGCDRDGALAHLTGLAAHLTSSKAPPAWLQDGPRDAPDGYPLVGDDIAFVLRQHIDGSYVAVTCLTRRWNRKARSRRQPTPTNRGRTARS
ncbi:MAG: hypothetical protein Q8O56_09645 [Solirubrobacteraceae bacterium]|nr:hypothetical protein [Solirubrobacteraceae bacterium]